MNIEILQDHIKTFNHEIVESGFKRDLDDFINSLPSLQNNIVGLREVTSKVSETLERIYTGDLPLCLSALLPRQNIRPFTDTPHESNFKSLLENTDIQLADFFTHLSQNLGQLKKELQNNFNEISKIQEFIAPYLTRESVVSSESDVATLSIAFKDDSTIYSLTKLTKTLSAWNRVLPVYHQLLKSDSPIDIKVVEVQNGSIELVINLNCDVAVNLAELFKIGFQCYVAYLSYKTLVKQITGSYRGNPKLLKDEKEREKDLLNNIGSAIETEVIDQHNRAKKEDNKIQITSVKKKAEEITKLVTSHIIKGNDIKLIAVPIRTDEQDQKESVAEDLRSYSAAARSKFRLLPVKERQLLQDKYSELPYESEESATQQDT